MKLPSKVTSFKKSIFPLPPKLLELLSEKDYSVARLYDKVSNDMTVNEFIDASFMESLTYHCLGLGFIALALKSGVKSSDSEKGAVLNTGITTVNGYLVQAIIGLGITILLSVTVMKELFYK